MLVRWPKLAQLVLISMQYATSRAHRHKARIRRNAPEGSPSDSSSKPPKAIPTSYKLDRRKAEPWQFFTPKTDIDDIKRLLKSRSTPHESNSAFGCREMKGCDLSRQTFRTRKEWYTAENFSAPHEWLIVAFADWKYMHIAEIWYDQLDALGYKNHYLVTIEPQAYDLVWLRGRRAIQSALYPNYNQWVNNKYVWPWRSRLFSIHQLLHKGYSVYMTDVDTIWTKYLPLESLPPGYDIYASVASRPPITKDSIKARFAGWSTATTNIGYRPTANTHRFLEIYKARCRGCNDALHLNLLLRNATYDIYFNKKDNMPFPWNGSFVSESGANAVEKISILRMNNALIARKGPKVHRASWIADFCRNKWIVHPEDVAEPTYNGFIKVSTAERYQFCYIRKNQTVVPNWTFMTEDEGFAVDDRFID